MDKEALGPAERIINTILTFSDHVVHNRPGMVVPDQSAVGLHWSPVTHREEEGKKVVYQLGKSGKKTIRTKIGTLWADGTIRTDDRRKVGDYRPAGMFPEVATWLYQQVADVWAMDNEFAARWASFAFPQEHRDLKVVLAAFMLVQSRKGDPVRENGQVLFSDEDFRNVGEAMCLIRRKDSKDLNPKLLLRIHDVLTMGGVAEINRKLGFGRSAKRPFLGRWPKAVERWLRHREQNLPLLEGLVKAGFRRTVMDLARRIGYKPETPKFFEVLRWKQAQADDGRRGIAIGVEVKGAETWAGMTEEQICERIVQEKPGFKRIVGLLPKEVGITRAVVHAAIESGAMSDKDLIIHTPMLEDLGLLQVQEIKDRWTEATKRVEDSRAANIAARVKNKETRETLEEASDTAAQNAVEEVAKNIRVYVFVDRSSSMVGAIEQAKVILGKFLHSFPLEQLHVAAFNTTAREVAIKHASEKGIEQAFRGLQASGGTNYGAGVLALQGHRPKDDEDVLFVFIGDEEQYEQFDQAVRVSNLNPMAFGFVRLRNSPLRAVQATAAALGIPCFLIQEDTFADTYAIPRTIRALVQATPVGQRAGRMVAPRVTLVDQIIETPLLQKPVWADVAA